MRNTLRAATLTVAIVVSGCERFPAVSDEGSKEHVDAKPEFIRHLEEAKAAPRLQHVFARTLYEGFLRGLETSEDINRRDAARVLRTGSDAAARGLKRHAVEEILASVHLQMPRDLPFSEFQEEHASVRAVNYLLEIDDTVSHATSAGLGDALGQALSGAYLAVLANKDGDAEILRVVDEHHFARGSKERDFLEEKSAYLSDLALYSYPQKDPAEAALWRDFMVKLATVDEHYGAYLDARDRVAASLLTKVAAHEEKRWGSMVPPPIWLFADYEWERFNFDWDAEVSR